MFTGENVAEMVPSGSPALAQLKHFTESHPCAEVFVKALCSAGDVYELMVAL